MCVTPSKLGIGMALGHHNQQQLGLAAPNAPTPTPAPVVNPLAVKPIDPLVDPNTGLARPAGKKVGSGYASGEGYNGLQI